jgi:hypothetical protein
MIGILTAGPRLDKTPAFARADLQIADWSAFLLAYAEFDERRFSQ